MKLSMTYDMLSLILVNAPKIDRTENSLGVNWCFMYLHNSTWGTEVMIPNTDCLSNKHQYFEKASASKDTMFNKCKYANMQRAYAKTMSAPIPQT